MYLLNTASLKLKDFLPAHRPPYIILSHTWGDEEVLYQDLVNQNTDVTGLAGWTKVTSLCRLLAADGWEWVWIDTCCIDKRSSTDLSEAINSMYQWYQDAQYCIVYLSDVSFVESIVDPQPKSKKRFHESRWFTRGWTLQELLAPEEVMFYDRNWTFIGSKHSLEDQICAVVGISSYHLQSPREAREASVAARMSWASNRETSRSEDAAYSLLGLFGVSMPLLYGEGGKNAFWRLQLEIYRGTSDESIFAWTNDLDGELGYRNSPNHLEYYGMLAPAPRLFRGCGNIIRISLGTIHAPRIIFDGNLWHIERHSKRHDQELNLMKEKNYAIPLACALRSKPDAPVRLIVSKHSSFQSTHVSRPLLFCLGFFSPEELQRRRKGWQVRTFNASHDQGFSVLDSPQRPFLKTYPGFCLRFSEAMDTHIALIPFEGAVSRCRTFHGGIEYLICGERGKDLSIRRNRLGATLKCDQGLVIDFELHDARSLSLVFIDSHQNGRVIAWPQWPDKSFDFRENRKDLFPGCRVRLPVDSEPELWITQKQGLEEGRRLMILELCCYLDTWNDTSGIFTNPSEISSARLDTNLLNATRSSLDENENFHLLKACKRFFEQSAFRSEH